MRLLRFARGLFKRNNKKWSNIFLVRAERDRPTATPLQNQNSSAQVEPRAMWKMRLMKYSFIEFEKVSFDFVKTLSSALETV